MSKTLDSILSQYEKNTKERSSKKISNEDRLKKYFTEKLQKGVKTQTKKFRILPAKDGSSPFEEVYYHEKEVNGKWPKIYCNHLNDGTECPLCEAKDALYQDGSEKAKKLAKGFFARKFYVVKGIDRDNEDHGVKFWRFKHKNGDGIMDKLIPLFQQKGDISDPREGRDIIITSNRDSNGWTVVSSIMPDDVSILTSDKEKADEWFNNEETHNDVYAKKDMNFLNIIATNKTPVWDSEQSKYVAEEDKEEKELASLEDEINLMSNGGDGGDTNLGITSTNEETNLDNDDELPF
jgi:hypothetical protein